jgi:hypothetical protein
MTDDRIYRGGSGCCCDLRGRAQRGDFGGRPVSADQTGHTQPPRSEFTLVRPTAGCRLMEGIKIGREHAGKMRLEAYWFLSLVHARGADPGPGLATVPEDRPIARQRARQPNLI